MPILPIPNQFGIPQIQQIPDGVQDYSINPIPDPNQLRFRNQMAPQQPAMDAYQNYLNQYPTRQDYQPSKLRSVLAGIGGVGMSLMDPTKGIGFADQIRDAPYNAAIQDWGMRGPGLQNAAQIESRNQANENTGLKNFANAMIGQQRATTQQQNADTNASKASDLATYRKSLIDNKDKMAQIAAKKIEEASKGTWKFLGESHDPNNPGLITQNLKTNEIKIVPGDLYGEEDKIKDQIDAAFKRTELTTGTSRANAELAAETSAANAKLSADTRQAIAEMQQENKVNTASVGQTNQANQSAIQDVVAKNPGWNGKWATKKGNTWTINPPDESNTNPAELQDFQNFYAEYKRYKSRTSIAGPKQPVKVTAPNATSQMIKVRTREGQTGQIPAGSLSQFLKDNPGSSQVP